MKCTACNKALGIGVFFEEQNLDSLKSDSEMLIGFHSVMAQAESENISANVRWGIQQRMKSGTFAFRYNKSAEKIRIALKKGIDNAEYSSILMDEIVHNHQIVPEMLRLIKESRFMIMDITQPNFGAYYEAGYAQGLGKEVIITCRKDVWDKKDFLCEKDADCRYKEIASKPHFDIAQKQVLVWNDYDDLTKQLSEWIRHIIG